MKTMSRVVILALSSLVALGPGRKSTPPRLNSATLTAICGFINSRRVQMLHMKKFANRGGYKFGRSSSASG